jgi:hypothetical protein
MIELSKFQDVTAKSFTQIIYCSLVQFVGHVVIFFRERTSHAGNGMAVTTDGDGLRIASSQQAFHRKRGSSAERSPGSQQENGLCLSQAGLHTA